MSDDKTIVTATDEAIAEHFGDTLVTVPLGVALDEKNFLEVLDGPSKGRVKAFSDRVMLGRNESCDLVITDKTVSREHALIGLRGKRYEVVNLNEKNFTLLNEKEVQKAALKNGDVLTLGETSVKVTLGEEKGTGKTKGKTNPVRIATLALVLVGLLAVIVIGVLPDSSQKKAEAPSLLEQEQQKQASIEDAARKREISVHLTNGKKYFDTGQFTQALSRYRAVLEIDPNNEEAKKYAEAAEKRINDAAANKVKAEQEAIATQEKVRPLLTQANVLMSVKKYAAAKKILNKAADIAPNDPTVAELLRKTEAALQETLAAQKKAEQEKKEKQAQLQKQVAEARAAAKAGRDYDALQAYEDILAMKAGGAANEEAKIESVRLHKKLMDATQKNFEKGEQLFEKEKYMEALALWRDVLSVYPAHPKAKARLNQLQPQMEAKGKELYQEGLVLEDLGQSERAVKKWEEALEVLFDKDLEYYKKTVKKLKEHGVD